VEPVTDVVFSVERRVPVERSGAVSRRRSAAKRAAMTHVLTLPDRAFGSGKLETHRSSGGAWGDAEKE